MRLLTLLFLILISLPSFATEVDRLILIKSQNLLMLIGENNEVLKIYRVALGANPIGHKTTEGDERTPEGHYKLDRLKEDSSFYRALHINYPNKADRAQARKRGVSPGGAIYLHGLPNELENWYVPEWAYPAHFAYNWTDGCIAVTNKEMDEIIDLVHIGISIYIFPY